MSALNVGPVVSAMLNGEQVARHVVGQLIGASNWFALMPYPDDLWQITVKAENESRLYRWIETASREVDGNQSGR